MAETVFILGAGASHQSGAPLMSTFIDTARRIRPQVENSEKGLAFDLVFKAISLLQIAHSKSDLDLYNLETVFGAFEMARLFGSGIGDLSPEEVDELPRAIRTLIVSVLELTQKFEYGGTFGDLASFHPPHPYKRFVERFFAPSTQAASVLTFNYDVGIDYALTVRELAPVYHLVDSPVPKGGVTVLKLHGSLNWAQCSECRKVQVLPLRRLTRPSSRDVQSDVRYAVSDGLAGLQCCGAILEEPIIVPPTWSKGDYHQKISQVWRVAAKELSEARNIVVIGYSMPDSDTFFRYLYALGAIGKHPLHRFIVVDPDQGGKVEERFRALLGTGAKERFVFINEAFDASIQKIYDAATP